MRTIIVALIVATILITVSQPAAAQQFQATLHLNYWGAPLSFGNPSPPTASDSASSWGAKIRLDSKTNPWSFSAGFDSMNVTMGNWPWSGGTFWDANVHYRFGSNLNSYFGVFAGYGGIALNSPIASQVGSTNGLRLGAEFLVRQPSGWYYTGQGSYGPSWTSNFSAFPGIASGNIYDLRAAVGYEFSGGWGLEAGWQYVDWKIPASTGCSGPGGCEWRFSGVTAAVTFRR